MTDKQITPSTEPSKTQVSQPVEQGIHSVAAKRSVNNHQKTLFLMGIVLMLVSLVAVTWFVKQNKADQDSKAQQEATMKITSEQTLTLPPLESLMPPPPPVPEETEVKEDKRSIAAYPFEATKEKTEPSLAERQFAAPMMGDDKSIQKGNDKEHLGLATTLAQEGYTTKGDGRLGSMLSSVNTPSSKAKSLGDRTLMLPKGTFINCILETKLDTTVPGMTSCVIPNNIYSANGKVLLIERGSKAVGEYKGAVENGLNRIFILWTQIQTPNGIQVNLDSPGADRLGGSGLTGEVNFHWWARFGNALLFSLVQDAFDFAISKTNENNGGVNYYQNSEDSMNNIIQEAMRQSGNIPPTLTKNQGEYIGIFVARDIDFSSVYALKPIR